MSFEMAINSYIQSFLGIGQYHFCAPAQRCRRELIVIAEFALLFHRGTEPMIWSCIVLSGFGWKVAGVLLVLDCDTAVVKACVEARPFHVFEVFAVHRAGPIADAPLLLLFPWCWWMT